MSKTKMILYYAIEFLISVVLFGMTISLILNFTVLDKGFMKSEVIKSDFVGKVYEGTKEEFSYYVTQSGLSEEVFDGVISEGGVNNIVNSYLDYYYDGNEIKTDTESVRERLSANIDKYLQEKGVVAAEDGSLESFKDKIVEIYEKQVENSFPIPQDLFAQVLKVNKIVLGILVVVLLVLVIVSKLVFKRNVFAIPLFTSGLLGIFAMAYLGSKISIDNFYLMTDAFSALVKTVWADARMILTSSAILELVVGVGILIIRRLSRNGRK